MQRVRHVCYTLACVHHMQPGATSGVARHLHPDIHQLLLRGFQPSELLHEPLALLHSLRWLLQVLLTAPVPVGAGHAQTREQGILQPAVVVQSQNELVINRHRDIVREPLVRH